MHIGRLAVALGGAAVWEPRPDWVALRRQRAAIEKQCSPLRPHATSIPRTRQAVQALRAGWDGNLSQLAWGAARLAGLGPGLTPAGDDFLVGVMLWAWLANPDPAAFCRVVAETAAPRTTTLSAAWLRAAAQGQCSAAWHQLLAVLSNKEPLEPAVQNVLAHGATSGADTLAGFLGLAAGLHGLGGN